MEDSLIKYLYKKRILINVSNQTVTYKSERRKYIRCVLDTLITLRW